MTPRQRRRERKVQNRATRKAREADQRAAEFWASLYGRMKRLVTWALLAPLLLFLLAAGGPAAASAGAQAAVNMWANYQPHAKQVEFHRSKARFKVLLAGRRSGKTYAAAREFLRRILADYDSALRAGRRWDPGDQDEVTGEPKPFLHYWAVAPSHPIGKVQRRETFDVLKGKKLVASYTRTRGELWLHGGILIEFKSAENPNDLVGAGLHGMWCDEAARLKAEAWTGNLRPTLTDHKGWALFSTTPLGRNWFDDEIVRRADPDDRDRHHADYQLFHFTSLDNPHLDPNEIETARSELPARYFAREYLASRDSFQGQIYDEFARATHVVPLKLAPFYDADPAAMATKAHRFFAYFVAGKDFGFSEGHSGVTLVFGVTKAGDWWALAELYEHVWLTEEWLQADTALQKLWGVRSWWADPSRPDLIKQYRRKGFNIRGARNDVLPGIAQVAKLMHVEWDAAGGLKRPPKFVVLDRAPGQSRTDSRGCPRLISELLGYVWATKTDGTPMAEEQPLKHDDHTPDSARYVIFSEINSQGIGPVARPPGA